MKISVVTAVYNRKQTILDAMESVLQQSWEDIEHIVQDGVSVDGTLDIIHEQNDPRISLVSAPDNGIYDAINLGMQRATGDVIGLMHSDDIFAHPNVLRQVATAFEDSQIDCVYGDLQYVAASDTRCVIRHWVSGPYRRDLLKRGWMPPHPTFYIRRSILDQLGNYDTSFEIAADYDAMLRWLWAGQLKPKYIPEVMVKMRMGGESNKSITRILQKSKEDYRALKKNNVGGIIALLRKNFSKISQFRL